jgi:uncharacterized protein YggT (Ycf19 family)
MSLINLILDLAGLLLWLSWRSIPFDPLSRATPATLAGTVRRAEPSRLKRWHFLAVLLGLLLLRAVFYWEIGPAVSWTPQLDLGIVALAFRGNVFVTALLFSILSFARTWIIFHFWLLALAIINGRGAERDPIQKMILLHLGWIARWPRSVQAILPALFTAAFWMTVHPLLAWVGVVNPVQSIAHLLEQGVLMGAVIYFTLKNLIPVFLFLYVIASYVYLGASPLWDYVITTSRRVLLPLNRLPLRFGRIDFAPLAGIVLILLLLHALPNLVLSQLSRRNLTFWPQ